MAVVGPLAFLRQAGRWIHTFHYGNYPYDNARYMFAERIFSRAATELVAVAEAQRQTLIKHHTARSGAHHHAAQRRARQCLPLGA